VNRTALLDWLDAPRVDVGLALADGSDCWIQHSYAELATDVWRISKLLDDHGIPPESVVSLILPTGLGFPAAFFGCLAAGAVPNPIAPPSSIRAPGYATAVAAVIRAANPRLIITSAIHRDIVEHAARVAQVHAPVVSIDVAAHYDGSPGGRKPSGKVALLQFTSGSTGEPRGVAVSWANLEANISAIRAMLRLDSECGTASWLPFHHDMGLIGTLLTPIANGSQLWLMRPEQFLRKPMLLLERMSGGAANITAGPMFGYGNILLRVKSEELSGLDFREWRAAIVGAERIDAAVLAHLSRLLEPHGFRSECFLPAYGLAEATLIVSGAELREAPRAVRIDWTALSFGDVIHLLEEASGPHLPLRNGEEWVVSCGRPIDGAALSIVDANRVPLPELTVGEITVSGSSVALMLTSRPPDGSSEISNGTLYTGDAGFIYHGELFVLGRMGTSLKVRGRTVFVEDLESRLQNVPGIPLGRTAIVAGFEKGGPCLIVLGETTRTDWAKAAADSLRGVVGSAPRIRVLHGPRGSISRTTSGKPRRKDIWRSLSSGGVGESAVRQILDSAGRTEEVVLDLGSAAPPHDAGRTTMEKAVAWVLPVGGTGATASPGLVRQTIEIGEIGPTDVLIEPIFGSWEGNMSHAVERRPIDVCRARDEPYVVLGNSGVVRVLKVGSDVADLEAGDICTLFGVGVPDRHGYMLLAHAYDAPSTVGMLAKRCRVPAANLIRIRPDTRHPLRNWAGFSLRYVTAWSNWNVAYGSFRTQLSSEELPAPHVWGWGGGSTIAELELAMAHGCRSTMVSGTPANLEYIQSRGVAAVDRSSFPDLSFDEARYATDEDYRHRYQRSERDFLDCVTQHTDGEGVSIFVDYIGSPLNRVTMKALARMGVLTTAGWKHGMTTTLNRAVESIGRHIHVHTHYARRKEAVDAVQYAEETGWLPDVDESLTYGFDEIPRLIDDYGRGTTGYFPIYQVNPE
jgi:fatty-acyl-CoA synthase